MCFGSLSSRMAQFFNEVLVAEKDGRIFIKAGKATSTGPGLRNAVKLVQYLSLAAISICAA